MKKNLILLAAAIVSGCGTTRGYDGPTMPDDQIAILEVQEVNVYDIQNSMFDGRESIYFASVDGKTVGNTVIGYTDTVEITPGKHEIEVVYFNKTLSNTLPEATITVLGGAAAGAAYAESTTPRTVIQADFKSGKKYTLRFESKLHSERDLKLWVEEVI